MTSEHLLQPENFLIEMLADSASLFGIRMYLQLPNLDSKLYFYSNIRMFFLPVRMVKRTS